MIINPSTNTATLAQAGEDLPGNVQRVATIPPIDPAYSATPYLSLCEKALDLVKGEPAVLVSGMVQNTNAALRYLWLYDVAALDSSLALSVQAVPARPKLVIPIKPTDLIVFDRLLGPNGMFFAKGLAWAISASNSAYSATGVNASDHLVNLNYF